jgi:hypothetical protein
MTSDIVGSREKAKNGYGQNGFQGPSSVHGAQPKLGSPEVAPPAVVGDVRQSGNMNAFGDHERLAKITSGGVAAHPGMAGRSHNSGSPSGNTGPVTRPVKK